MCCCCSLIKGRGDFNPSLALPQAAAEPNSGPKPATTCLHTLPPPGATPTADSPLPPTRRSPGLPLLCREETYTRILKMRPHLPAHLSENARDFVSQCLRKEPGERPTVLQLLRHPWVRTFQVGAAPSWHGWPDSQ